MEKNLLLGPNIQWYWSNRLLLMCSVAFSIGHGRSSYLRHANTKGIGTSENALTDKRFNIIPALVFQKILNSYSFKGHKSQLQISTTSNNLSVCFPNRRDPTINKVTAAELTQVHSIQHSLSHRSLDCDIKLLPVTFKDSEVAAKMKSGQTKASRIVVNVLAKESVSMVEKELTEICLSPTKKSRMFFEVMTDASNYGSSKLFPFVFATGVRMEAQKFCAGFSWRCQRKFCYLQANYWTS